MVQNGLTEYYWDCIWRLWNQRNNPKIKEQLTEYLTRIELNTDNPSVRFEVQRTKSMLRNEEANSRPNNHFSTTPVKDVSNSISKERSNKEKVDIDEDLPIRMEDLLIVEKPKIGLDKIGGLSDVKEILKMEVIYPRIHPNKYQLYGRTPGNGVLLWGAPGCGKTLLAKAIAKETGETAFISPKVSDMMNRWVGQSEKIIKAIFDFARTFKQATLFFDEIDYIAPRGGPSYMMRIKRELLQQMDGIGSKKDGLLLFGATNRPWLLDPAARRPSPDGLRFSKVILVPPPDIEARAEIFNISLAKVNQEMIADDVDSDELAKLTDGFSGADIGAICEEAIDIPLKEHIKGAPPRAVCMNDFLQVLPNRPKSIIPWIIDALRSARKFGEDNLVAQIEDVCRKYDVNEQEPGNR
jgi:transitional endoplasmic reticulum ATPase